MPLEPLTALPNIGDSIVVMFENKPRKAVVISMAECRKLRPDLWGKTAAEMVACHYSDDTYTPDENIRAFKYEDGTAEFCIMRFHNRSRTGYDFNHNLMRET